MVMDRELDNILSDMLPADTVRLTRGELLLLDWVLCTGSSLMAPIADDLFEWHDFRLSLWEAMPPLDAPLKPSLGVLFSISETDAKIFLTTIPTTFSWGDGLDVGCSLKEKLAARLLGNYVDPQPILEDEAKKENEDDSKDETQSNAPSPPAAGC